MIHYRVTPPILQKSNTHRYVPIPDKTNFNINLEKYLKQLKLNQSWECKEDTNLQGVPEKIHTEWCGIHVSGNCFWSFLTKTRLDQALQSHAHGKIWPHSLSTQFWLGFFSVSHFFGTLRSWIFLHFDVILQRCHAPFKVFSTKLTPQILWKVCNENDIWLL